MFLITGQQQSSDRRKMNLIQSSLNLYWKYASKYHRQIRSHDVDKYRAPCNPYKIEWVDPSTIQEITRRPRPIEYEVFGEVRNGDWDIRENFDFKEYCQKKRHMRYKYPTMYFEDSVFYRSLQEHFENGVKWKETKYVRNEFDRIQNGKTGWGGSTTCEGLLSYCETVDELYQNILNNGYKTQEELRDSYSFLTTRRNEIMVDIGRDGKLLYVDSRHRLAISKILNLDAVPVVFGVRHPEWMETRDSVYDGSESKSHPDLRSI